MKYLRILLLILSTLILSSCGNEKFIITEDAVYSSDGRTLYKYIGGESFTLPEHVLYIAPNAFAESPIKHMDFGENLKFIGTNAFWFTDITSVNLPESVVEIDPDAFDSCFYAAEGYIPESCHVIYAFTDARRFISAAPFYQENYLKTEFSTEPIVDPDCFFMSCERTYREGSPGSSADSPENWRELYYEESPLTEVYQDMVFTLISDSEAVIVYRGWFGKQNVFFTTDGGMTWTETESRPHPTYDYRNRYVGSIWNDIEQGLLYYDNMRTGRFCFEPNEELVQLTTDGGRSWKLLTREDFASDEFELGYFDAAYTDVSFDSDGDMLRIGFTTADAEGKTDVSEWISTDGGTSWGLIK